MGNTATPSNCPAAVVAEVELLRKRGVPVELVAIGTQCFAQVGDMQAPSPPWDRSTYGILIAVPLAAGAALDAFYLELPYKYESGIHPRVCGTTISFADRNWQLVSWHYPDGRPWTHGKDDLDTHIAHCRGFFFNRGAVNTIA
jgi:Prokaryotic E2 family E